MADSYYECHITVACHKDEPRPKGMIESLGWKFSAIDGDIVEGEGVRCYATRHFNSALPVEEVMVRLHTTANVLTNAGYNVTRRKIEHVIYDDRSSKICPPNCLECILPTE